MAKLHRHYAESPPTALGVNNMATFEPRQLNIAWGNGAADKDALCWKIPKESGFPAELLQVCWLEVTGSIPCAVKGKKYQISFAVSLKPDAFGWNNCPVYVMAKFGEKGTYFWKKTMLLPSELGQIDTGDLDIECNERNVGNGTIYFGLYEVWSGKWKGGLLLHSATVKQIK